MHALATTQQFPQTPWSPDPRQQAEWLVLLQCSSPRPDLDRLDDVVRGPFSWPVFLRGAEEHCVLPLVAARVKDLDHALIPPEVHVKLRELQRTQTLFALQLTAELFRLLAHFANAGIQVLITKGTALAVRCYGEPGMRQYGDLDLIVRKANMRRATQAMLDLAYEPRIPLTAIDAKKTVGEYAFRKPGTDLLVEFHTGRTFRYHPRPLQIEKLFERGTFVTIDRRRVLVFSLEDELVLICVHGAKHFWERLMWVADVAALISRQPLDWDRALAVANEVGAQRILHLGLRLAADLLDAELPAHLKAPVQSDRTVAKLAAQIESRLMHPELHDIGILQRAAFRVQMRGGLVPGLAYLLRLSLTPTEEDWSAEEEGNNSSLMDAISRPVRLARKHSRRSSK